MGDKAVGETLAWIRANAISLVSVEAGNGFADLEPLRTIIGDARIVSLGEATHGTREFFQLKHRLLEFCISELGFTIFGIEASYPECLRINDYVLHGTGNPADALAGQRFWTWDTEEVLALIKWMRAWNSTHERQVKFYGFDMQFPTEAALGVLDYLKRVAPALATASEEPLWPLSDDFTADRLHLLPGVTRDAALVCVKRILDAFAHEKSAWIPATSELEWLLARLNAVVLDQGARMRLAIFDASSPSRDIAMAENVAALLKIEGPEAKAVLWAHNGHARKIEYVADDKTRIPTMGSRLHELFGGGHLVVGFAFNRGSFQAIESGRGLVDHTIAPAPKGSLDGVLASANMPALLMDMATTPATGPVPDWLASQPVSRSIGSVYWPNTQRSALKPSTRAALMTYWRLSNPPPLRVPLRWDAGHTRPSASRRRQQPIWSWPAAARCRRDGLGLQVAMPTPTGSRAWRRGRPPAGAWCASRASRPRGAGGKAGWSRRCRPSLGAAGGYALRVPSGPTCKGRGPAHSFISRCGRSRPKE